MPGLPVQYLSELRQELQDYLRAASHLYIRCDQVMAAIDTITVDQVNEWLVSAAVNWRETRGLLNSASVAHYEWQLASQAGWGDAGTFQASVLALDNAWSEMVAFYAAKKTYMLNTRNITLDGITSPLIADDASVKAALVTVINAILATKGS